MGLTGRLMAYYEGLKEILSGLTKLLIIQVERKGDDGYMAVSVNLGVL